MPDISISAKGTGRAYRGLIGRFLLLRNFSVAISVSPRVCLFFLVLIFVFYVSKMS